MDVPTFLSKQVFGFQSFPHHTLQTKRTTHNYFDHTLLGPLTTRYVDDKGQSLYPSAFRNTYTQNISLLQSKIQASHLHQLNANKVYESKHFMRALITQGVEASNAMFSLQTDDNPGMSVIENMMKCVNHLTSHNEMRLEPFQLKAIRACICSAGERLLGDELHRFIPKILQCVGLIKGGLSSFDPHTCSEALFKQMMGIFHDYSKSIVTVVAPRRNGKSKAGKLFVAVNAVCERGARIVLMAHRSDSIHLYESEVKTYLDQLLSMGLGDYKVHSAKNEIRVQFPDKSISSLFFVSGGVNVSIVLLHYKFEHHPFCGY